MCIEEQSKHSSESKVIVVNGDIQQTNSGLEKDVQEKKYVEKEEAMQGENTVKDHIETGKATDGKNKKPRKVKRDLRTNKIRKGKKGKFRCCTCTILIWQYIYCARWKQYCDGNSL